MPSLFDNVVVFYLESECPEGDCKAKFAEAEEGCKFYHGSKDPCYTALKNGKKAFCEKVKPPDPFCGANPVSTTVIIACIAGGLLFLMAIVFLVLYIKKRRNRKKNNQMLGMAKPGTTVGTTTGTTTKTGTKV